MTTDNKKSLGLYIHIPFCKNKCNYCDFCSVARADSELNKKYLDSLCREIAEWSGKCRDYLVDTIYIGGGTPTVLEASELVALVEECYKLYSVADGAEISCECNPATIDKNGLRAMREGGINRLSIGLQSANENEMRALGRIHNFDDFLRTFEGAREAGFDNISADLMYGIPEQTEKSLLYSLETLSSLSPEHISAYCLKVEGNTPFARLGDKLILPDEDTQYAMYKLIVDYLRSRGYDRYEISNFSKKGRESRHNLRYWTGKDYIGFGAAAHSYFDSERFSNAPN